jgi:hypothetical protein
MIELYNFILKIMNIVNEYYEPDLYYINLKYKLDSIKEFNKFYYNNLNYNKLLLFNSIEAEKLFIRLINLDENYIERKYNQSMKTIITDFINNKNNNYYFSICDEFFSLNKSTLNNNIFIHQIKTHVKNCNCKIKVKSIVNLSINTLIKIIKNGINYKKNYIYNLKKKIKNSKNNLDLLDCIKMLNTIKANMGIDTIQNNYTIEESIQSKNYQFDTEYPIEHIQIINSLIQKKLNDFSYSINSNVENNKKLSKDIFKSSKEESKEKSSKEESKEKSSKEESKEKSSKEESSKEKSSKEESKEKSSKEESKEKSSKEESEELNIINEFNKEDLLFRLEKIIEYFMNINVNNFGECLSGFELIYNLKKTYKKNSLIVKSIEIILEKIYKSNAFDKGYLIKNIYDLCKIIKKE